jgi:hypothetical protein
MTNLLKIVEERNKLTKDDQSVNKKRSKVNLKFN